MDPATSIITLVQFTGTVIGYINDVKGASEERKRILDELSSTHYLLFLLKDKAEAKEWGDTIKSLAIPKGPLEQFKDALERLASKLAPAEGLKKVGRALTWPFQKDDVKYILSTIERQKSLFSLALQNDHV
jgi:hypothetical protein